MRTSRTLIPALALILATACSADNLFLSTSPPDDLGFGGPYTREGDYRGALMLVGDTAYVRVGASRGGLSVDPGTYTITSSDPAVVRMLGRDPRDGLNWRFIALAPGSATVTLDGQGFHQTRPITVLNSLPPLDEMRVRIAPPLDATYYQPLTTYGPDGSLTSVTVPAGESVLLAIQFLRSGREVWGVGADMAVALPAVARLDLCPPPEVAPDCIHPISLWLTGVAAGETTISVAARNLTTSFVVKVVSATPFVPALLTPASGAIIAQNDATIGCAFSADHGYGFAIDYSWSPVSDAAAYHLRTYHPGSPLPMLDIVVTTTAYRFLACNSYVTYANSRDWRWTVATIDAAGAEGPWASERTYQFGPYP